MQERDFSRLQRARNPMPAEVEQALAQRGLAEAFARRPPYQQNDYLGWIERAKRAATRQRRLEQMLQELEAGNVYMKMDYRPRVETLKGSKGAKTR
jgi:uncharacterized protein YdeI (YjbR/CyaY-like superfamily)